MKHVLVAAASLALLAGLTAPPAVASNAQFSIKADGPAKLQAGLSGTYVVTALNEGDAAPVQLFIVFAGKLEQTGQISADGGFDCTLGHDAGTNAVVRCTVQKLQRNTPTEIVVQGRGSSPGAGQLVVNINPDGSVPENPPMSGGNDNLVQKNVAIT